MLITLEKLSRELGGELTGDASAVVSDIRDIEEAGPGDLSFVFGKKFASTLEKTKASCVVAPTEIGKSPVPIIKCKNPNLAFKKAIELILPSRLARLALRRSHGSEGIHKTVSVGDSVKIGKDTAVGAFSCLEDGAEIGDGTVISAQCYIGHSAKIGKNCVIHPNVTIREDIKIGDRVIIHPGSVIGSDGFGYERTARGHEKIPQIGNIVIEDDVEIGACVTVDRAKIAHTRIGRGTKIDNLVQIAHNVTIGSNCIIVAQCGISGSTKIGNNVMMAGQVGLVDHIEIGDNVMIGAQSGLMKSVPSNAVMWGSPARPARRTSVVFALCGKLPEMYKRLKAVEKKLGIGGTPKDNK